MKHPILKLALLAIGGIIIALGISFDEFDKQHYDTLALRGYRRVTLFSIPVYESYKSIRPGYELQYKEIFGKDAPPDRWRTGPDYYTFSIFTINHFSRRETYSGPFRDSLVQTIYSEYMASRSSQKAKKAFKILEIELPPYSHLTSDDSLSEDDMKVLLAIRKNAERNILKIYQQPDLPEDGGAPITSHLSR